MNEEQRYQSYLLRLWETTRGGEGIGCASLQDPHTGERKGFASLKDLFPFLEEEIGRARDQPTAKGGYKKEVMR